ncbi:phage baseplate assembly protein V [Agrobacterium sp. MS2]|uniref:phage baseplate assembly protein V n=1 Tax=Agrobacterium sp. MS2 TaxID=1345498 RepID=UPI001878F772|nr:phage baseplate assembly protein V [Agrobacterium sp. MS2]
MRDPVALELRRQVARIEAAERRLAQTVLTGKVAAVDREKRKLRLKFGTNSKGEDVLGPWVRWQEAGVGVFSIHSEPQQNEQMVMVSMSGTIGSGSFVVPGSFDQDNPSPSDASDETVMKRKSGKFHLVATDGFLFEGPVEIKGDFQARDGTFRHNEKNVGDTHGHVSAPPGIPGGPV